MIISPGLDMFCTLYGNVWMKCTMLSLLMYLLGLHSLHLCHGSRGSSNSVRGVPPSVVPAYILWSEHDAEVS